MSIIDKLLYRTGTCPWWFCFTFDNPLRRLMQNPEDILKGLVHDGDTVLDIGCGMGYFSLPLAGIVGSSGRVICMDLQDKMLDAVKRRATRAGLVNRIKFIKCTPETLGLTETTDFALAFWMVHEVRNKPKFFQEIREVLGDSGKLLLVEPKLHVTKVAFEATVSSALAAGFKILYRPNIKISMAVLLQRSNNRIIKAES